MKPIKQFMKDQGRMIGKEIEPISLVAVSREKSSNRVQPALPRYETPPSQKDRKQSVLQQEQPPVETILPRAQEIKSKAIQQFNPMIPSHQTTNLYAPYTRVQPLQKTSI